MTPEAQRRAIAHQTGWTLLSSRPYTRYQPTSGISPDDPGVRETLPDYLGDLNAMAEVEATLNDDQLYSYYPMLLEVCSGREEDNKAMHNEWQAWAPYRATAAQRAEAYLRTMGMWKGPKIPTRRPAFAKTRSRDGQYPI